MSKGRQRWVAAYKDGDGRVHAFGSPTAIRVDAEDEVSLMRIIEAEDYPEGQRNDWVVATRMEYEWEEVER